MALTPIPSARLRSGARRQPGASHSSRDNARAVALGDWLVENGWSHDDVFLDIDPASGIAPGERWQRALNEAAGRPSTLR